LSKFSTLQATIATAKPGSAAPGWPRLRISLSGTASNLWNMPSMRQLSRLHKLQSAIHSCRGCVLQQWPHRRALAPAT